MSCKNYINRIGVSHNDCIKIIYFDTPGSSLIRKKDQKLIILDTKYLIFDTLFDSF